MQVSLPHWTPGLWRFRLESCIGRCLLLCGLCACVSGRSIAESPTLEEASNSKVWVYSLVGTNYDGYKMLPFFLQHYRGLGIPDSQFHFDVLHDPDEPEHGLNVCADMQAAKSLLKELGISYEIVTQPYTPALQDIRMTLTLDRKNIPPLDWVIVADTDELYTYGHPTIKETVAVMEAEGATYALGEMLDHVARNGSLPRIQDDVSLWKQFPMVCPVTGEVGLGLTAKVTLHRGFLRVGAGHHHIVDPELAEVYFDKRCHGELCDTAMKKYGQRSTVDLFHKTPYYRHQPKYKMADEQASKAQGKTPWVAKMWKKWTQVHHFKWHDGMRQNLQHRAVRDSGDCVLGVNEETCKPNFMFWHEVARQYAQITSGNFNLTKLGCDEDLQTFWNYEQYKKPAP